MWLCGQAGCCRRTPACRSSDFSANKSANMPSQERRKEKWAKASEPAPDRPNSKSSVLDRRRPSVPVPLNPRQSRVVGMERPADPIRSDQPPTVTNTGRVSIVTFARPVGNNDPPPYSFLRTVPRKPKSPSAPLTFCPAGMSTRAASGGARSRRSPEPW